MQAKTPQRRDGAVAMGDLDEEQPQRHQRREQPVPPRHLVFFEQLIHAGVDGKIGDRIAFQTRQELRYLSHPWPPVHEVS